MRKNHIIDKLFNIVIIIIILFSTIFLYNSLINYIFQKDKYYTNYDEYKQFSCVDEKGVRLSDSECKIQYNNEKEEYIDNNKKSYEKSVFTSFGIVIISFLFLKIVSKKDFLKEELGLKILNAILLLVFLAGLLVLYSYIMEVIYYNMTDELLNAFKIFGFVIFPILFYYIINKYLSKEKKKQ
jgi:hypothetical protein